MAELDWEYTRIGEITLVELRISSEFGESVQLESTLEPVWPPRRHGRAVAGWEGTCFEGDVPADEYLVVGYASPDEPADPPAEIVESHPIVSEADERVISMTGTAMATGESIDDIGSQATTAAARTIIRELGESGPPRDVVPLPEGSLSANASDTHQGDTPPLTESRQQSPEDKPVNSLAQCEGVQGEKQPPPRAGLTPPRKGQSTFDLLDAWFDDIETRIQRATRVSNASGVETAREAITAEGGIEEVRELKRQVETDHRELEALRDRTQELLHRVESTAVPLETLERIV